MKEDLLLKTQRHSDEMVLSAVANFSIIIPVYNSGSFLSESIRSALSQDMSSVEVIAVDDGSTDGSHEVALGFEQVTTIRQKNAGDSAARNTGLAHAAGEFVVFLDHDDLLEPHALRRHLAAFHACSDADMVFGSNVQISETGAYLRDNTQSVRRFSGRDVALNTTPSFSQCMYRKAALDRIGGFRPGALNAADHDLNIRLLGDRLAGFCHGEMVMSYRKHLDQQTRSPAKLYTNHMRVLKSHFGPDGFLADPAYLVRLERRWKTYYGRAMPGETARLLRRGKVKEAMSVLRVFAQTQPYSGIGALRYLPKRLLASRA